MHVGSLLRRRFYDFRLGHSTYLALLLSFSNFILITYTFAIKSFGEELHINLILFTLIFVGLYIPIAVWFGYWHRKNQIAVEAEAYNNQNWQNAWIGLIILDLIEGKATTQQKNDLRQFYEKILKRTNKMEMLGGMT